MLNIKGFAIGPFKLEDVPKSAKFSGLMTRPKPNGGTRIILNLSAPKKRSVNDGIDSKQFPTKMSSTTEWLRVLHRAGKNCWILKTDLSDAYKHIAVRLQDVDLQWFEWLGMGFAELCLIFGCTSSAGIFDAVAKIFLYIVLKKCGFDPLWIIQHLDDFCAACPHNKLQQLQNLDKAFMEVAQQLGVSLAPRDDPTKSFAPSHQGVVLGIEYDTQAWTWSMPQEKLARMVKAIAEAVKGDVILQCDLWSITGKIIHIMPLIPAGKYVVDHILRANSESEERDHVVTITDKLRRQLCFWRDIIPLCSGHLLIPNPDTHLAPWAINVDTDASGGTTNEPWHGVGAVAVGWWAFMPWGQKINTGQLSETGKQLDRVMSCLELLGPLLVLSAGASWLQNKHVRIFVDNDGAVHIFRKGYSTSCPLSSSVVKAISTVAAAIGCSVEVAMITRCSSPGARMADMLSKGKFELFKELAATEQYQMPTCMATVPNSLLAWVADPKEDDFLGNRILEELAVHMDILGVSA